MVELTLRVPEEVAQELKMLAEKLASVVEGGRTDWLDDDKETKRFRMDYGCCRSGGVG